MANIFGVEQQLQGSFRADKVSVQFAGYDAKGLLLQNIQFNYTQQVTTLYEIGSAAVYFVGGRASGNAGVSRIVGPSQATTALLQRYGDICNKSNLTFKASGGCQGSTFQGSTYTLSGVVLTTIAQTVAAQDIVIHEQLQFIYVNLNVQ
jgi:hypothetical protein